MLRPENRVQFLESCPAITDRQALCYPIRGDPVQRIPDSTAQQTGCIGRSDQRSTPDTALARYELSSESPHRLPPPAQAVDRSCYPLGDSYPWARYTSSRSTVSAVKAAKRNK